MRSFLLLVALALSACSSGSTAATTDAGVDAGLTCQDDPRAMTFATGVSIASSQSKFHLQITAAQPAPPSRDTNVWTVRLTDAAQTPVSGATITAKPWMPDHNHGASVPPTIAAGTASGDYDVQRIDFVMPGLWQVIFTIVVSDGTTDTATFAFCIPS
jgi:hypothetical protein